jgi:hypothetical protein
MRYILSHRSRRKRAFKRRRRKKYNIKRKLSLFSSQMQSPSQSPPKGEKKLHLVLLLSPTGGKAGDRGIL